MRKQKVLTTDTHKYWIYYLFKNLRDNRTPKIASLLGLSNSAVDHFLTYIIDTGQLKSYNGADISESDKMCKNRNFRKRG